MNMKQNVPTELNYHKKSRVLEIAFGDDRRCQLTAEFLRVYSPSAEVRGHGPDQQVLQIGKEGVGIDRIEPVTTRFACTSMTATIRGCIRGKS